MFFLSCLRKKFRYVHHNLQQFFFKAFHLFHDAVGKTEPKKTEKAEPKKAKGKAKKKSSDLEL